MGAIFSHISLSACVQPNDCERLFPAQQSTSNRPGCTMARRSTRITGGGLHHPSGFHSRLRCIYLRPTLHMCIHRQILQNRPARIRILCATKDPRSRKKLLYQTPRSSEETEPKKAMESRMHEMRQKDRHSIRPGPPRNRVLRNMLPRNGVLILTQFTQIRRHL